MLTIERDRRGYVTVSEELLFEADRGTAILFRYCVPIGVEHIPADHVYRYLMVSPFFRQLGPEEPVPEYIGLVHVDEARVRTMTFKERI